MDDHVPQDDHLGVLKARPDSAVVVQVENTIKEQAEVLPGIPFEVGRAKPKMPR